MSMRLLVGLSITEIEIEIISKNLCAQTTFVFLSVGFVKALRCANENKRVGRRILILQEIHFGIFLGLRIDNSGRSVICAFGHTRKSLLVT